MSDYIKLFSTESERTDYEASQDFKIPYVSLSEATGKVHYLSVFLINPANAEVGDIMLNNGMCVSSTKYSMFRGQEVGIVGIKKGLLPDGKGRIISTNFMDISTPTTGSRNGTSALMWGANGDINGLNYLNQVPCIDNSGTLTTTIQTLKNYGYVPSTQFSDIASLITGYGYPREVRSGEYCPCPFLSDGTLDPNFIATSTTLPGTSTVTTIANALADFDGTGNTQKIMANCTVQIPTKSNSAGNYPAAHLCTLYNVGNLDWYLPSLGELELIQANQAVINTTRAILGQNRLNKYWYWSSTLYSSSDARGVSFGGGRCSSDARSHLNSGTRVLAVSAF